MKVETEKHYKLKPISGMWGILTLLTIGLAVACLCGAPISGWWILAPLGIPIVALIGLPIYVLIALAVVVLLALALILVGLVPILLLAILFGVEEKKE